MVEGACGASPCSPRLGLMGASRGPTPKTGAHCRDPCSRLTPPRLLTPSMKPHHVAELPPTDIVILLQCGHRSRLPGRDSCQLIRCPPDRALQGPWSANQHLILLSCFQTPLLPTSVCRLELYSTVVTGIQFMKRACSLSVLRGENPERDGGPDGPCHSLGLQHRLAQIDVS